MPEDLRTGCPTSSAAAGKLQERIVGRGRFGIKHVETAPMAAASAVSSTARHERHCEE
jgi:hypothetical protein